MPFGKTVPRSLAYLVEVHTGVIAHGTDGHQLFQTIDVITANLLSSNISAIVSGKMFRS